jgi:hypothetical protein
MSCEAGDADVQRILATGGVHVYVLQPFVLEQDLEKPEASSVPGYDIG